LDIRCVSVKVLVDGDVGIVIFPEGEEIIVGLARGNLVAHHHLGAAELKVCEGTDNKVANPATLVKDLTIRLLEVRIVERLALRVGLVGIHVRQRARFAELRAAAKINRRMRTKVLAALRNRRRPFRVIAASLQ
jgi:hypothetical protein